MRFQASRFFFAVVTASLSSGILFAEEDGHDQEHYDQSMLYTMKADGTDEQRVSMPHIFDHQGMPVYSYDGKQIAYDALRCWKGDGLNQGKVVVANADGSNAKTVCTGLLPSFSPSGKFVAFSQRHVDSGVYVIKTDGTDKLLIRRGGWGGRFSPDGRYVSYITWDGKLHVYDIEEDTHRCLFEGEHANRYSRVFWAYAWSADSQWLCYRGVRREDKGAEFAIVNSAGSDQGFEVLIKEKTPAATQMSFHPDGQRILISHGPDLVAIDRRKPGVLSPIPNQTGPYRRFQGYWSPDGERIVYCRKPKDPPKPAEKPMAEKPIVKSPWLKSPTDFRAPGGIALTAKPDVFELTGWHFSGVPERLTEKYTCVPKVSCPQRHPHCRTIVPIVSEQLRQLLDTPVSRQLAVLIVL